MAATTSPTPRWRSTSKGKILGLRVKTKANLGAYLSTFSSLRADLSLRAAAVGPVRHPGDLLRGRRRLHQHRAGRRLSRRGPAGGDLRRSSGWWRWRRASSASDPASFRRQQLRPQVPAPDAGHHDVRRGRLRRLARQGAGDGRLQELRQAQARERPQRQAARHRLLGLHRGLRHRAVGGGGLARRGRRPVGIGRGAGQPGRHRRGAHRLAPPRPGPRDDLRAARLRPPRHPDRPGRDRPRRHRQGAVRHGHLRLALRRGRHVGHLEGARQGDRQGQEGRGLRARGVGRATSSSRTAASRWPAPTSRWPSARWRCRPTSPTSSRARSWSRG